MIALLGAATRTNCPRKATIHTIQTAPQAKRRRSGPMQPLGLTSRTQSRVADQFLSRRIREISRIFIRLAPALEEVRYQIQSLFFRCLWRGKEMPPQGDQGSQSCQDYQQKVSGRGRKREARGGDQHSQTARPPEHFEALRVLLGCQEVLSSDRVSFFQPF